MTPIDLCVSLSGPLVHLLLPITLETLRRHDSMEGVTLHLVDKDCSEPVKRYLATMQASGKAMVHQFTSPPRFTSPDCPVLSPDKVLERDVVNGTVTTLKWMTDNCGSNNWVFVMHFDLEFLGPWLTYHRDKIADGVGQVGDHCCGLVGYNRIALRQAEVDFSCIWNLYVHKNQYERWVLRHESDPRCVDKSMPFHGWDTNELLELGLQHWGWKVLSETDVQSNRWRVHHGSGSGRCGEAVNNLIRDRAVVALRRLGLAPIQ